MVEKTETAKVNNNFDNQQPCVPYIITKNKVCVLSTSDGLTQGSTYFFFLVKSQTGQTLNTLNRGGQMVPMSAIRQCQHTENIYPKI